MRFRLMSYNIHKGIGGVDRRYRPERVIEVIDHCQPDVVFLQEVTDGVPRAGYDRQVDLVADGLELRYRAYRANVKLRRGKYGNAILSRFPLTEISNIDLTVPLKKRRGALVASCHVRDGRHSRQLVLCNVHLGLAGFERAIQVRRLLACDYVAHMHPRSPIVIAGDFNDLRGALGKRQFEPAGFDAASGQIKTFPAFRPIRALDRIFYRGKIDACHCFASRTSVAKKASDHFPVVADFECL